MEAEGNEAPGEQALPVRGPAVVRRDHLDAIGTTAGITRRRLLLVDSHSMRNQLEQAVQYDIADDSRGSRALHDVTRLFVVILGSGDEADTFELVRQLSRMPPHGRTTVRMIDPR